MHPKPDPYNEYIDRIGELISGEVKKMYRGEIIVDLRRDVEAFLPRSEQTRSERWIQGERIRAVITNVYKRKGPQVEVSRTSVELLRRLLEQEVPEIDDGKVVIKAAVREPNERAKIAVIATASGIDPVEACLGMKGSRVQAITRELRGEKIDVIEWSDELTIFAARALAPAKVNEVRVIDAEQRLLVAIVSADQLSLAVGKRGQNVRLANQLVGGSIDLRSEDET